MDDRFKQPVYVIENNKVVKKNMGEIIVEYFPAADSLAELPMEEEWQILCALEKVPDFVEYKKHILYYTEAEALHKVKYNSILMLNQEFQYDHLSPEELAETIEFLKSKKIIT